MPQSQTVGFKEQWQTCQGQTVTRRDVGLCGVSGRLQVHRGGGGQQAGAGSASSPGEKPDCGAQNQSPLAPKYWQLSPLTPFCHRCCLLLVCLNFLGPTQMCLEDGGDLGAGALLSHFWQDHPPQPVWAGEREVGLRAAHWPLCTPAWRTPSLHVHAIAVPCLHVPVPLPSH